MLYKYYERARSSAKAQYNIKEVENNVFSNLKTERQKKDFAEYTYLKLNAERLKKGKSGVWTGESAIDEKTSKQMAKKLENKNPRFKELSNRLYDYLGKQQQMLVDSGFASEDASDYFYETYVPTIRELAGSKNTSPLLNYSRKSGLKSPIRSAKGSERNIVDLEKAIALTTIRNQRAVDENNARKELLNSVGGVVGGERLSFDETHNIGNDYQMSVYKDGRLVTMTVTKDIAEAYTPTKYYAIEDLLWLPRGISKAQRGVLTQYNPVFLFTNLIKDSQDALINTKFNNLEYLANLPRTIEMMATKSKEFQQYKKNGGFGVTYYDSNKETFRKENALTKVKDRYENITDNIEQVWRFNEYLLTKKKGGTESEAMYNASEVTTNFARGGDLSKALDRNGAIFLNASIQGFDKQIRNFKDKGAKGAVRLLIRGALLSMPYWFNQAVNGDDEKYQKISEYTKQNNYIIRLGDTYFKIPRGRALSVYTTALQDMWETAGGKKKIMEALQNTGSSLVENIAPNNPIESNVLSPLIQAKNNTNYYGNKIVSDYMAQKPKEEQYDEKTDMISRYIGKAFNFSPKKVNYVIDQYTGWVGDAVLPQLTPSTKDTSNIFKKKFIVDTDTSNQSYFDLKSKQESYEKEIEDVKDLSLATSEQQGKALSIKYLKDIKEKEISPLYKEIEEVRNIKYLDENEKAKRVEELYNQIYEISKSASDDADAGVVYDDYAVVGHYEYRMIRNEDGNYVWSKISDDTTEKQEKYFTTYGITAQTYYSADRINRSLIANSDEEYDRIKEDIKNIKGDYENSLDASKDEKNYNKVAKKREVFNYINNLDLTLAQKAMLMKQEYSGYHDYDKYIFDYINNADDLTYDEKTMILLKNGFKYNKRTGTFK
jgi:3-methyladenine DNA glycosylase Tag